MTSTTPSGTSHAAMPALADSTPSPAGEQQFCTAEQLLLLHLFLLLQ
jgi:hypothetical protein